MCRPHRVPGFVVRWLVAAALLLASTAARAEPTTRWLLLSDLHFDPLVDSATLALLVSQPVAQWRPVLDAATRNRAPSRASYGQETSYPLLASALREMHARAQAPPVVVIAGDLLPHHFQERFAASAPAGASFEVFAAKTMEFLAHELDAVFPQAQFLLALGNNDSACGDYCVEPGGVFLTKAAAAWAPLVNRGNRAPGFAAGFAAGSLYVAALPGPGSPQAIVLDTVLWSTRHRGDAQPGRAELDELAAKLAPTPGAPTWRWFVAHVPPSADAFTSAKRGEGVMFLTDEPSARLAALLTRPSAKGAVMIAGHTHHASFELITAPSTGTLPLVSLPAVSPIFDNNPAFSVADVDSASGVIAQITTFVFDLATANGWAAEAGCRAGPFDPASLRAYQSGLLQGPGKTMTDYLSCSTTQSAVGAVPAADWPWYVCADTSQTRESYCGCVAARHAAVSCR